MAKIQHHNTPEEIKYESYINEHIFNVQKIWKYAGNNPCLKLDDYYYHNIDMLIHNHDASKYSFAEFNGYRCQWYPSKKEIELSEFIKKQYDLAWNHHQKNNPHHWEYWILIKNNGMKILDMQYIYIIEMLCDWSAMSLTFKGIPSNFYNKNKNKMILSSPTIKTIDSHIKIFDKIVIELNKLTEQNNGI